MTKEYTDTLDLSPIEMNCFGDFCVYMTFRVRKFAERVCIDVTYDHVYLCTIKDKEQLDYFYYGIFRKPIPRKWKEANI